MNLKSLFLALNIIVVILVLSSCEKENETKISSYGNSESHNMGQDCMNCHKNGGDGEGWFNIAGTVYEKQFNSSYPNATVHLYTGPGGTGTLNYTIQVDAKGNFYTTESIDFGAGLYPAVEGETSTEYMITPVTNGKCNSCHGITEDKIWTL